MLKILSIKQVGEFFRCVISVGGVKYEAKFEKAPTREYLEACWRNDVSGSDWKRLK